MHIGSFEEAKVTVDYKKISESEWPKLKEVDFRITHENRLCLDWC